MKLGSFFEIIIDPEDVRSTLMKSCISKSRAWIPRKLASLSCSQRSLAAQINVTYLYALPAQAMPQRAGRQARLMKPRVILSDKAFQLTLSRLCHQLIENHGDFSNTCLIGVQPRGVALAERIVSGLKAKLPKQVILYGQLDATFYRDDFRRGDKIITANAINMEFSIEGKDVVLIDDVFYTGRTIRAAMDALLDFGRPKKVELLTLIDRRFSRHVPIQPDYTGRTVDAVASEVVKVEWKEQDGKDRIILKQRVAE